MKYRVLLLLVTLISIVNHYSAIAQDIANRYTKESVLSEGKWVKIRVSENGIYKLTYDDIRKMGFNDPSKVKLYGYGGWVLEELFTKPYVDDLPEVPVWTSSSNGFKSGDYILFYGRGPVKWSYETVSSQSIFNHKNNPYDTYGHYFLKEDESGLLLMNEKANYSATSKSVTVFDDYYVHERDSVAILKSGRDLFGESFASSRSRNFDFNIPGLTNDPMKIYLSFAAGHRLDNTQTVTLSIGEEELIKSNITKLVDYYASANMASGIGTWTGNKSESFRINITYSSTSGISHLNFISLNYKRNLRFYNQAYTFFRHTDSRSNALTYLIENATNNCFVWDITDPFDVKKLVTSLRGTQLSFGASSDGTIKEYVMIDTSRSFPAPEVVGEISNQNLHGLEQADMIIIAPKLYTSYAEQLARKHEEKQEMIVRVVQSDLIFNEFSSGTRDATAYRRFLKMFYDRGIAGAEGPSLKYLLLYGDGIFDNRHLASETKSLNPDNYLLTYQFQNSVDEKYSYGTDDYFGLLADSDGDYLERNKLKLGIGRFPVSSVEQAKNALEKVINYMENSNYGSWRNTVIFTADDTGSDSYCAHAKDADKLAVYLETNRPEVIVAKSYMDAFQSVDANGKKTYPDAKNKFLNTLKNGCLLTNYAGHGSPTSLSAEDMVNISDIRVMNFSNLPLWITATCDFGWFDSDITSAGEEVFLNKTSAGIALYTTTRVVYANQNSDLNERIIKKLFPVKGDRYPTLGDVFRDAKNDIIATWEASSSIISTNALFNKLNFVLLGDPALVLNYPQEEVVVEKIFVNDVEQSFTEKLNFRALDKVTIEGTVVNALGEKIQDFNGSLYADIFDAKQVVKPVTTNSSGLTWSFDDYQNKVYMGTSTIESGSFSFTFKVPLDISYNASESGKMSLYVWDEDLNTDAVGTFQNYTLSGSNDNADLNEDGPLIELMYLNSGSFKDGETVHETPYFYAKVSDEDGINMSGNGIGHDITICIDNNAAWTYNLNSYYQAIDATSGTIGFSIPELPVGEHQLSFKVWDILNNSSTATLNFKVAMGAKPKIYDVQAWPNPAKEFTKFVIEHNRPETFLEVEIKVFDLTGRSLWSYQQSGTNVYEILWNLDDTQGRRLQPGIYLYQAIIKTDGSKEATKSKKIIIQEQ